MAEPDAVAKRIIEYGWQQGDVLGPLSVSVAFDPDKPYSKAAKASPRTEVREQSSVRTHGVATSPMRPQDRVVLASQTCDIVRNLEQEPNVVGLRGFYTEKERILAEAKGNSPRYFLLVPSRGLVVDARQLVLIEKPLLANLERVPEAVDSRTQKQFARWLGRRFNRPALPDDVVTHVGGPITNALAELRRTDTDSKETLARVSAVRMARLEGAPPYAVRLLFVLEDGLEDKRPVVLGLARIVADLQNWLGDQARIVAWDAVDLYEIAAGDYLNTIPLNAEHLTEQGSQSEEALPDQYGNEDFA